MLNTLCGEGARSQEIDYVCALFHGQEIREPKSFSPEFHRLFHIPSSLASLLKTEVQEYVLFTNIAVHNLPLSLDRWFHVTAASTISGLFLPISSPILLLHGFPTSTKTTYKRVQKHCSQPAAIYCRQAQRRQYFGVALCDHGSTENAI